MPHHRQYVNRWALYCCRPEISSMVKHLVILLTALFLVKVGYCDSSITGNDTLTLEDRLEAKYRACKQLYKKRVVYRLNADTLLFLGRDRSETIVGYVGLTDFKANETKIFIYDSAGLFQATVRENFKRPGNRKRSSCFYDFENGTVVLKGEQGMAGNIVQLLREAAFLRSYVAPLRTNHR